MMDEHQAMASVDLPALFVRLFATHPIGTLYANAVADTSSVTLAGRTYPITITHEVTPNCYTLAPHAAIVDYAKDETVKLPRRQALPITAGLSGLSRFLKFSHIDKVVGFNNYGLSTNTLNAQVLTLKPSDICAALAARFGEHAYLIRSLNRHHHGAFIDALSKQGWDLITSRQVYVYDDIAHVMQRRDIRRDFALLDDARFVFVAPSNMTDYTQAVHWYNCLYLDKYSWQNVQFTPNALHAMHTLGIMQLWLLIDTQTGASVGVTGVVSGDGIVTAPLVGYDTSAPQSQALYRRVIAKAMHRCHEHGLPLNLSSGAPDFKTNRGAAAVIEYTAVYRRHLSAIRQAPWQLLSAISPHYAKLLIHQKL